MIQGKKYRFHGEVRLHVMEIIIIAINVMMMMKIVPKFPL